MNLLFSIIFSIIILPSFEAKDQILGEYWTEGKTGKIAIYKCNNLYCGKILWREKVRKDFHNPDPYLAKRSVIGIEFLKDFYYNSSQKKWVGGTVYSIDNGGTYQGKIWLEDQGKTLKMRGYIGFSLLGRTITLKRIT